MKLQDVVYVASSWSFTAMAKFLPRMANLPGSLGKLP